MACGRGAEERRLRFCRRYRLLERCERAYAEFLFDLCPAFCRTVHANDLQFFGGLRTSRTAIGHRLHKANSAPPHRPQSYYCYFHSVCSVYTVVLQLFQFDGFCNGGADSRRIVAVIHAFQHYAARAGILCHAHEPLHGFRFGYLGQLRVLAVAAFLEVV